MQLPRYVRQLVRDCFDEEQYQAGVSLIDGLSGTGQYQPDSALLRNLFALSLSALGPEALCASRKRKKGSNGLPSSSSAPTGLDFSKRDVRPPADASVAACQLLLKLADVDAPMLAAALPPQVLNSAASSPAKGRESGTGTGNTSLARSPTASRFGSVARGAEQDADGERELEEDEEGDAALSPLALKCDELRRTKNIWDALDLSPVGEIDSRSPSRKPFPLRASTGSRKSSRKMVPTRKWADAESDGSRSEEGGDIGGDDHDDDENKEIEREIKGRWKRDGCWSLAEVMLVIWRNESEQRERDEELGLQPQQGNLFLQCGGSAQQKETSFRGSTRFQPASELGDALNFAFAGLVAAGGPDGRQDVEEGTAPLSRHEGLRRARVGAALLSELSLLASKGLIDRDALVRGVASRVKFLGIAALEQLCLGGASSSSSASSNADCQAPLILAEALVAHLKASSEVHHSATIIGRSSPFPNLSSTASPAMTPNGFSELCALLDEAEGLAFLEPSQTSIVTHLPRAVRAELGKATGSAKDPVLEALADLEKVWPIERTAEGEGVPRSMLGSKKAASRSLAAPSKRSSRLSDPKRQQQQQGKHLSSKDKAARDEARRICRRLTAEMRAAEIEARLGQAVVKCGLVSFLASHVQALALSHRIKVGKADAFEEEGQKGDAPSTADREVLASLLDRALQSARAFAGALTTSSDEASSCIKHLHTDPDAAEAWGEDKEAQRGKGIGSSKRARTLTPTPSDSTDLDGHPELVDAIVRAERGASRLRGLADALTASNEVLEMTLGCHVTMTSSMQATTPMDVSEGESEGFAAVGAATSSAAEKGDDVSGQSTGLKRRKASTPKTGQTTTPPPPWSRPPSSSLSSAPTCSSSAPPVPGIQTTPLYRLGSEGSGLDGEEAGAVAEML